MEIEKSNTKKKENFPNFFPLVQNLQAVLEVSKTSCINLDFIDSQSKDQEKSSIKKAPALKISEAFTLDSCLTNITDFSYFSLDSAYILALLSGNIIYFVDLPKKPSCFFQLKETIRLTITEKKEKPLENAFEGIFKSPNLEQESLNCCDFGYKLRTNGSKINFEEDETDLILACAGKTGLIYLITVEEDFPINYLYGHINEVFSIKFAHPNQTFNFQNILLSGGKDGAIIMWNIKNEVKIVVFVPKQYPHSDILSVAWAPNCDYIASVGLDNVVKIWKINHVLKKKIEESHFLNALTAKNLKKIEVNSEAYRNKEAHQNFEYQIDQIEFYGILFFQFVEIYNYFLILKFSNNFEGYSFLTKDVFGNIVFWVPNFDVFFF